MTDFKINSRYRNLERIGTGGMAEIYRAFDSMMGIDVAIKRIKPELWLQPSFRSRFQREVKILARLDHPNIASILDFQQSDDDGYYVMRYYAGESLADSIAGLDGSIIEKVIGEILEGLSYLHSCGIVHRDIKPGNVLFGPDGRARITDFGISSLTINEETQLTRTGTFLGTHLYASPEQLNGEELGAPSDVYQAGILIYEILTGSPPFRGSPHEVTTGHLLKQPPEPDIRWNNPNLRARIPVLKRCLEKRPGHRYANAADLKQAWESGQADRPGLPVASVISAEKELMDTAVQTSYNPKSSHQSREPRPGEGPTFTGERSSEPASPSASYSSKWILLSAGALVFLALAYAGFNLYEGDSVGAAEGQLQEGANRNPETASVPSGMTEVEPRSISASSSFDEGHKVHNTTYLQDRNRQTAWCEGAGGAGEGEYLNIIFGREVRISSLILANGFQQNSAAYGYIYKLNGRVRKLQLQADGQVLGAFDVKDRDGTQLISFPEVRARNLRLTILETYPGSRWPDTCISELYLYGPGQ